MKKLSLFLVVILALGFGLCVEPAHAEFRWGDHNIGSNPLMPFPVDNEQLLVQGLTMRQPQIGRGLTGRVPGDPFLVAVHLKKVVAAGQVQRAALPPGTRFPFMISAGGVNTNVVWIGPGPLEGFVVGEFFIPRQCGNLVPLPPQPRTPPPPQMVAPPPQMVAPPPQQPVCAAPQPPAYQAEASLGLGLGLSSWCGGGNNNSRVNIKETNISNVYAPVYAPTSTYAPVVGNGNTRDSGNTRVYAPTTTDNRSWTNRQSWVSNQQPAQPAPCPQPQPQQQNCGPGQPAGRGGNGWATQAVLTTPAAPMNNGWGGTQQTSAPAANNNLWTGAPNATRPVLANAPSGNNGWTGNANTRSMPANTSAGRGGRNAW